MHPVQSIARNEEIARPRSAVPCEIVLLSTRRLVSLIGFYDNVKNHSHTFRVISAATFLKGVMCFLAFPDSIVYSSFI